MPPSNNCSGFCLASLCQHNYSHARFWLFSFNFSYLITVRPSGYIHRLFLSAEEYASWQNNSKFSRSRKIKMWCIAPISGIILCNLRSPEESCREPVIINRGIASQCGHCHIRHVKSKPVYHKMSLLVSPRCHEYSLFNMMKDMW